MTSMETHLQEIEHDLRGENECSGRSEQEAVTTHWGLRHSG